MDNPLKLVGAFLSPYYRGKSNLWSPQLRRLDARIAVSTKWMFTYIRIPKAGNTTVMDTLNQHFNMPEGLGHATNENMKHETPNFQYPRRLSKSEVQEMIEQHFIFTFVRNPFYRILSAYLDKFQGQGPNREYVAEYIPKVKRFDSNNQISFKGFCRYLAAEGIGENPHWTPQSQIIRLIGLERVNFVGRMETLAEDLTSVVQRISNKPETPEIYSTGTSVTHAGDKCTTYYDDECVDIIKHLFEEDFKNFNYSAESP